MKLVTLNVTHAANAAVAVYPSNFPMEDGYTQMTGIAIVNKGTHLKFDVGVNDLNNNTKLDLVDYSFMAPGQNGSDRFTPVDIPLSGNKLIVQTSVREQIANAIEYQVIARIEK